MSLYPNNILYSCRLIGITLLLIIAYIFIVPTATHAFRDNKVGYDITLPKGWKRSQGEEKTTNMWKKNNTVLTIGLAEVNSDISNISYELIDIQPERALNRYGKVISSTILTEFQKNCSEAYIRNSFSGKNNNSYFVGFNIVCGEDVNIIYSFVTHSNIILAAIESSNYLKSPRSGNEAWIAVHKMLILR